MIFKHFLIFAEKKKRIGKLKLFMNLNRVPRSRTLKNFVFPGSVRKDVGEHGPEGTAISAAVRTTSRRSRSRRRTTSRRRSSGAALR